jgi:spermidine synthase
MTRPWTTLASAPSSDGMLELRRRGESDYLITVGGRVLMNSFARASEEQLALLALSRTTKRVLIGGLGMGFTLRAALDALPRDASVVVAELNPVILEWCQGPLAAATNNAVGDPRVRVEIIDVARLIRNAAPNSFDAIVLDLYEGPNAQSQRRDDPFYSAAAIESQRTALAPNGVLAVWSEDPDTAYEKRLGHAFRVKAHTITAGGSGGRKHVVYLATR